MEVNIYLNVSSHVQLDTELTSYYYYVTYANSCVAQHCTLRDIYLLTCKISISDRTFWNVLFFTITVNLHIYTVNVTTESE